MLTIMDTKDLSQNNGVFVMDRKIKINKQSITQLYPYRSAKALCANHYDTIVILHDICKICIISIRIKCIIIKSNMQAKGFVLVNVMQSKTSNYRRVFGVIKYTLLAVSTWTPDVV